jgi:hypothetical protein
VEKWWQTRKRNPEPYPEKWDQALVIAVGVVNDAIDLLERAPSLRHQLHRLLVPVMHPPLDKEQKGSVFLLERNATGTKHKYHQMRSILHEGPPSPAGSARRRAGRRSWKKRRRRRSTAAPTRRTWRPVACLAREGSTSGTST